MRLCFFSVILVCFFPFSARSGVDSLLLKLDEVIANCEVYVQEKVERINDLKAKIEHTPAGKRYDLYADICDEYKKFIYDSAFIYARKLQQEAYGLKDPSKVASSKVALGFILVSSGMFNEALDTLLTVDRAVLSDSVLIEFYSVVSRAYYDLVDFNLDTYYTDLYTKLGNQYVDSGLVLCKRTSSRYHLLNATKQFHQNDIDGTRENLEALLSKYKLTDAETANAASTLGYIYTVMKDTDRSIEMQVVASMADYRASIKETTAILNLAKLLFERGDLTRSYDYVKLAMDDANFYGSRHRKIQVAAIFPIIEGNRLDTVEHQRRLLVGYAILITVLSMLIIGFGIVSYRQYQKLKAADKKIQAANVNLLEANRQLHQVNNHLMEANKIKEEYIGYYFNINSEYLMKIESFKQAIDNKLRAKKIDDIRFVVNNINLKKEREELYFSFDKVFLKLFPDFVTIFNSYFNEEDRIVLKDGQLLNTELRIFALIRMGIQDTEKIAKILDYSINTIYNYKARVKSKSIIPNDEFEAKIMEVEAL